MRTHIHARSTGRARPCAALLAMACIAWSKAACPCAPAPSVGEQVATAGEKALIVWDGAHHVEHFIRNAVFDTGAKSFGFLVPTPSRPTLGEAGDDVFYLLFFHADAHGDQPVHWVAKPVGVTMLPFVLFSPLIVTKSAPPEVTVLEETRVAGLDATVLAASDAGALGAWLSERGFALRASLKRWLAVYVAKKWNIVAFRYQRDAPAGDGAPPNVAGAQVEHSFASRAVRLTFATDEPVYPYREPDDAPERKERRLELYVAADRRLDGVLLDDGLRPWAAPLRFSMNLPIDSDVTDLLPGLNLPPRMWISEFDDPVTKRPPTDVVFRPGASAAEVPLFYRDRPFFIPYELPFIVGGVWWWRRRSKKQQATAP
jgi:Uncharacterized protein conserved in bacteria (DUF2330)